MNITINGKTYVTKRDRFGWTLNSPFDGVSKTTNEPVIGNKTTYHATFGQTLTMIADRELGGCEDLQEVREMVQKLREELLGANVADQTPAALDSANTTGSSSRLAASVLFVLGCSWWFLL